MFSFMNPTKYFKGEMIVILCIIFPKIEAEGTLSTSFFETSITLKPKLIKGLQGR